MTTRTSDRFDLAHESRKAILTHLIEHGRSNTNQVADALSMGVDAAGRDRGAGVCLLVERGGWFK